jgi:DNA polymerase-3 subunit beta
MRLSILKDKIKEGVGVVAKISQKFSSLPILQNTLFTAEKNFLKLATTNLETSITWWGLVKVEKEGQVCIPTKFISNLIAFLPNKPVDLDLDGFSVNLKSGNYNTKIKGLSAEDFPIIPQVKNTEQIVVDNLSFCQSLNQIINIPAISVANPEISGIFLSFEKDLIKMVATDSFRLAEKKIPNKKNLSKEYSLILPQNSVRELVNIFGEKKGDLKIFIDPNQIMFEFMMEETDHPSIQFTSRLVEGEYPNYQEIIPKKYETKASVQKEEFLNQIKAASLFGGKINEVKIRVSPKDKNIEIQSQSAEVGEHKSSLEAESEGKEIEISFNHRFLIDGVAEIKGKEFIFELTNQEGPALIKPVDGEEYLYIIMPIKAG